MPYTAGSIPLDSVAVQVQEGGGCGDDGSGAGSCGDGGEPQLLDGGAAAPRRWRFLLLVSCGGGGEPQFLGGDAAAL